MIEERVTVIGTGALGSLLAKTFSAKEVEVYSLFNRSSSTLQKLSSTIKPTYSADFPTEIGQLGEIVFITIPDRYILNGANRLANIDNNFSNKTIVHCSGTKPAAVLDSLKEKGASTAAFHPIQTFSSQSKPNDFTNIYLDIEGDKKAKAVLKKLAKKLEAHCIEVSAEAKPYLHAAGVMTSNYLFSLLSLAASVGQQGGMDRQKVIQAMLPLAAKTVENAQSAERLTDALSGPIARGDDETVAKHLNLLSEDSKLYQLYQLLGKETLEIAKQNGQLTAGEQKQLSELLNDHQ